MISIPDKKTELTTFCENNLNAVKSGVASEKRFRRATELGQSIEKMRDVMGDPLYYLEVLFQTRRTGVGRLAAEGGAGTVEVSGGQVIQSEHVFRVSVFYEYTDADSYDSSSQSTFEDLMYGATAPKGLSVALDEATVINPVSERVIVKNVQQETEDVIPMAHNPLVAAHFWTAQVAIEG